MGRHTVMLLRHAEKPEPARGERAVDARGGGDDHGLSVRGWQRAGALVRLFAPRDGSTPATGSLAKPAAIFAAASSAQHPSRRPCETVRPLADLLGLQIDQCHACEDDPDGLVAAIDACDSAALVCWRHDDLPRLARALGGGARVPTSWPEHQYDQIWVIDRGRTPCGFEVVAQRLLAGDRG